MAVTATLTLSLLAVLPPRPLDAQVIQETHCMINPNVQCPNCASNPQPALGCTAAPPANWSEGQCQQGGLTCTQWLNYNCGVEITCGWNNPTGNNCANVILCR
jgi:hypothetical protein